MKDHIVRKTIKDAAIEVEKTEGRGQIKVSVDSYHCIEGTVLLVWSLHSRP